MPIECIYLIVLLAAIVVWFVVLKRPIYESMLFGYIVMLTVTGQWANWFKYIKSTTTNTLFYAIVAFLAAAQVFTETHVIERVIDIVLSVFGRLPGGAGWISLISSTFMGALSGSGAGNVAATGVFTIPAMKRSGFPSWLAANVECSASTMGNMIPPAGVITAAFGVLATVGLTEYSMSNFWIVVWGIAIWFIAQRAITLLVFCKIYHVKPMGKDEVPPFAKALKEGWSSLMLAVVIFLPFFLDSKLKGTFFTARLGAGASNQSSCILLMVPGLAAIYAMIIVCRKGINISPKHIAARFSQSAKAIIPVSATIFFAYCISNLFTALDVGTAIGDFIAGWGLSKVALAILIPLFCAFLGMIIPGSSQIAIFGTALVTVMMNAGCNPILICAVLPAITGAMEGMTPPLALCMYTGMGIADAPMRETTQNCLIWVALHYLMSVITILGILPILGM